MCSFTGPVQTLSRTRISEKLAVKITCESLERTSIRALGRRYKKTKKTILRMIHEVTRHLPDSVFIQKKFLPQWSGILVFDGKVVRVYDKLSTLLKKSSLSEDELRWMHKMRFLVGVDFDTGDLPHYDLAQSESKIELVIYFKTLKDIGYPLKALVCDGNPQIPEAVKFVFGEGIVVQLCTRHFIEGLRRMLPQEEEKNNERIVLENLIAHIQRVIEACTVEEARTHLQRLEAFATVIDYPLKRTFIKLFQQHKNELCAHLLYPEFNLPHTSNDAENLIRQLNQRLKTWGRFFHRHYAKYYLNAWALLRRFTPFTDCKEGRRCRNGKAPLELAGCEIKNIDPLNLRQEPF